MATAATERQQPVPYHPPPRSRARILHGNHLLLGPRSRNLDLGGRSGGGEDQEAAAAAANGKARRRGDGS